MRRSIPLAMTGALAALAPAGAGLAAAAAATTTTATPAASATATATAAAKHTYRGPGKTMRWGTVQVTITVSARRVTGISASYPTERPRSQIINSRAIPALRSEALAAQSARIHTVSGATLSSEAFDGSLQSALHAAHLA